MRRVVGQRGRKPQQGHLPPRRWPVFPGCIPNTGTGSLLGGSPRSTRRVGASPREDWWIFGLFWTCTTGRITDRVREGACPLPAPPPMRIVRCSVFFLRELRVIGNRRGTPTRRGRSPQERLTSIRHIRNTVSLYSKNASEEGAAGTLSAGSNEGY